MSSFQFRTSRRGYSSEKKDILLDEMGALDLYKFCPIFGIRNLLLYTIICQPQHSPGHSLEKFVGIPNYGQYKRFFLKIHSSIKFSFKLVLKKCTMYL